MRLLSLIIMLTGHCPVESQDIPFGSSNSFNLYGALLHIFLALQPIWLHSLISCDSIALHIVSYHSQGDSAPKSMSTSIIKACLCSEKTPTALFFKYNTQLGPPYQVLVDTNFINFSIKNKVRPALALHHSPYLRSKRVNKADLGSQHAQEEEAGTYVAFPFLALLNI